MTQSARLIAVMMPVSAVMYMERISVSIAAPDIIRELSISETQMGYLFSAFYLAYTGCMFVAGAVCDRFGPRRTLIFSGFSAALFTALTAVCGVKAILPLGIAFACLLAVRFASGACAAPFYPACAKLIGNWFPPSATAGVQSSIFGVTLLGMALMPLALTPVIRDFGWRSAFFALAACLTVVYGGWALVIRDRPPESLNAPPPPVPPKTTATRQFTKVLRNRNLLRIATSYAAFCYFSYLLESWAFYYYREVRHFGPSESAFYMTGMLITAAVAAPSGGWLSDRLSRTLGRRIVPIVGLTLSVSFCAIGAAGLSPLTTAVSLALAYGFLNFCESVFWAVTIETTGEHCGTACGLLNTGGNLGGMLSPVLTPLIASRFGWTVALCAGGAVAMSAIVPWLFLRMEPSPSPVLPVQPEGATAHGL